jgi:hypothetical protein
MNTKTFITYEEKLYISSVKAYNRRVIAQTYTKLGIPIPDTLKPFNQHKLRLEVELFLKNKIEKGELIYGPGDFLVPNPKAKVSNSINHACRITPQKLWVTLQWMPTLKKALIEARTANSIEGLPEKLKAHIQVTPESSENQGKIDLAPNTAKNIAEMLKYSSTILKDYASVTPQLLKTAKNFARETNNFLTTLFDPAYNAQKPRKPVTPSTPNKEPILNTAFSPAI